MFVDASVLVAVLAQEDGWEALIRKIDREDDLLTSPLANWEASLALARLKDGSFDEARNLLDDFIEGYGVKIIPITPAIGALAIEASRGFGRGRHPAALNMGDCFAYACARAHRVPLLFKGDDFPKTDIEAA